MEVYKLESKQHIKTSMHTCWDFFSSPKNLKIITPSYMGFEIIDAVEGKIYPGQIIQYKVKPLFGIPLLWVTEITHVSENKFFVDEQRIGPYKLWHHKHFFKEVKNGIEIKDVVHYALPFGFLGRIANKLFIQKQLHNIFEYRYQKINNIFNEQ